MIIKSNKFIQRYNISERTLRNLRTSNRVTVQIPEANRGFLFDTDITDQEARDGKLGTGPLQAILTLDQTNAGATP